MNQEKLFNLRVNMESRLVEVQSAISAFKKEIVEATESQTNFLQDGMDHALEQGDLAARIELHERNMLMRSQLQVALERIQNGSFGECLECGEYIGDRRLEALPTATCCVGCKRKLESSTVAAPSADIAWIGPNRLYSLCIDGLAA